MTAGDEEGEVDAASGGGALGSGALRCFAPTRPLAGARGRARDGSCAGRSAAGDEAGADDDASGDDDLDSDAAKAKLTPTEEHLLAVRKLEKLMERTCTCGCVPPMQQHRCDSYDGMMDAENTAEAHRVARRLENMLEEAALPHCRGKQDAAAVLAVLWTALHEPLLPLFLFRAAYPRSVAEARESGYAYGDDTGQCIGDLYARHAQKLKIHGRVFGLLRDAGFRAPRVQGGGTAKQQYLDALKEPIKDVIQDMCDSGELVNAMLGGEKLYWVKGGCAYFELSKSAKGVVTAHEKMRRIIVERLSDEERSIIEEGRPGWDTDLINAELARAEPSQTLPWRALRKMRDRARRGYLFADGAYLAFNDSGSATFYPKGLPPDCEYRVLFFGDDELLGALSEKHKQALEEYTDGLRGGEAALPECAQKLYDALAKMVAGGAPALDALLTLEARAFAGCTDAHKFIALFYGNEKDVGKSLLTTELLGCLHCKRLFGTVDVSADKKYFIAETGDNMRATQWKYGRARKLVLDDVGETAKRVVQGGPLKAKRSSRQPMYTPDEKSGVVGDGSVRVAVKIDLSSNDSHPSTVIVFHEQGRAQEQAYVLCIQVGLNEPPGSPGYEERCRHARCVVGPLLSGQRAQLAALALMCKFARVSIKEARSKPGWVTLDKVPPPAAPAAPGELREYLRNTFEPADWTRCEQSCPKSRKKEDGDPPCTNVILLSSLESECGRALAVPFSIQDLQHALETEGFEWQPVRRDRHFNKNRKPVAILRRKLPPPPPPGTVTGFQLP